MKFKTTLKSPVFKFVKKSLAYNFVECLQPQQNEVTTRVTGINYNCNVFFSFFINRNIIINTYFMKMLLKTILKMSYNTYTGVDTAFERG